MMDIKTSWKNLIQSWPPDKVNLPTWLLKETRPPGLDIGSHSVKVVQMEKTPSGFSLRKIGYRQIPTTLPSESDASLTQEQMIAAALSDLWKQLELKTRIVSLVISDPAVYLRHISIPYMPEQELIKGIKWLAEKYTPFPMDDAIVDFQILNEMIKKDDNRMDIVIIASEKKTIDKYLTILKAAKLSPLRIDMSCFSVAKALLACHLLPQGQAAAIIDIGAQNTSVVITKGDRLQLARNFLWGGDYLTAALAKGFDAPLSEAEKIKKDFSLSPEAQTGSEGRTFSFLEPVLSEFVNQVNRCFIYGERELSIGDIQKVYLCGGAAALSGLDQFLTKAFGLSAVRVDADKHFPVPQGGKGSLTSGSVPEQFLAALGAAGD